MIIAMAKGTNVSVIRTYGFMLFPLIFVENIQYTDMYGFDA